MQSSLERELSAYFCGARADMENPEVTFALSKMTQQIPNLYLLAPSQRNLVLEIRVRDADIGALFAFVITKSGVVLGKGPIATARDAANKVLWYCYGQPFRLLYQKEKGWFCSEPENHLYIFGLLPDSNRFEIYKAKVELTGKGGKLLWKKVCEGQCFYQKDWIITAEQKSDKGWASLAGLFENLVFQEMLKPYIFRKQIPQKDPEAKEEKPEKFSAVLL